MVSMASVAPQTLTNQKSPEIYAVRAQNNFGDEEAWGAIHHLCIKYTTYLRKEPHLREEVISETLFKLCTTSAHYNPSIGKLEPWLRKIIKHTRIDIQKKNSRRPKEYSLDAPANHYHENPESFATLLEDTRLPSPTAWIDEETRTKEISETLKQIPKKCKTVIISRLNGFSYDQIARRLEIPLGTVKSRSHLGRKTLHDLLETKRELLTTS